MSVVIAKGDAPQLTKTEPKRRVKRHAQQAASEEIEPRSSSNKTTHLERAEAWAPSSHQWSYLRTLIDAIAAREPVTDVALCRKLKMSRRTVWEWKQNHGFRAWFRACLEEESTTVWPQVIYKHENLALAGSTKSFEVLARLRSVGMRGGGFEPTFEKEGASNYTVNLLLPRPNEPLPAAVEAEIVTTKTET